MKGGGQTGWEGWRNRMRNGDDGDEWEIFYLNQNHLIGGGNLLSMNID